MAYVLLSEGGFEFWLFGVVAAALRHVSRRRQQQRTRGLRACLWLPAAFLLIHVSGGQMGLSYF